MVTRQANHLNQRDLEDILQPDLRNLFQVRKVPLELVELHFLVKGHQVNPLNLLVVFREQAPPLSLLKLHRDRDIHLDLQEASLVLDQPHQDQADILRDDLVQAFPELAQPHRDQAVILQEDRLEVFPELVLRHQDQVGILRVVRVQDFPELAQPHRDQAVILQEDRLEVFPELVQPHRDPVVILQVVFPVPANPELVVSLGVVKPHPDRLRASLELALDILELHRDLLAFLQNHQVLEASLVRRHQVLVDSRVHLLDLVPPFLQLRFQERKVSWNQENTQDNTKRELSMKAIIPLFQESPAEIIPSILKFLKHRSLVINSNFPGTTPTWIPDAKFSIFVQIIKLTISFVLMERFSIKNIWSVSGGTNSIVAQLLLCTGLMKIFMTIQ